MILKKIGKILGPEMIMKTYAYFIIFVFLNLIVFQRLLLYISISSNLPTCNCQDDVCPKPVYPKNGVGQSVDVFSHFHPGLLNRFCYSKGKLISLIVVYSHVRNFRKRRNLRNSLGIWAKKLNSTILFISGVSDDKIINTRLRDEYEREKDILVIGKLDTAEGQTNKGYAMLKWINEYCNKVPFVIRMLEDAFIRLDYFLEEMLKVRYPRYIFGGYSYVAPDRDPNSTRYQSEEEYPAPYYPLHLLRGAYGFRGRMAGELLKAVHIADYCPLEEVWLTGHVRDKAYLMVFPLQIDRYLDDEARTRNIEEIANFFFIYPANDEETMPIYTRLA